MLFMARQTDLLKDLDHTKSKWAISVRVLRIWEPLYGQQKFPTSLELLVSDVGDTKIWCTVPKPLNHDFKRKVRENAVYRIKDFFVVRNVAKGNQCKVSTHPYKINFYKNTQMEEVHDNGKTQHPFNTKSFIDITTKHGVNEIDLIDVVGMLQTKHDVQTLKKDGTEKRMLTIFLQDLEKNILECTLWNTYVDQLFKNVNFEDNSPVIILLQLCQAKTFQGRTIISNAYYDETKLWINAKIQPIIDFKHGLVKTHGESSIPCVVNTVSSQSMSIADELQSHQIMTIEDLLNYEGTSPVWTCGTILGIVPSDKWYYMGCRKCSRGIKSEGTKYKCLTCKTTHTSTNERYVLEVNVVDSTAPVTLTLWDRECNQVYGKTAKNMRSQDNVQDGNSQSLPSDLDLIVGRTFLFKVQVKASYNNVNETVYNVVKLTEDEELINKFGMKDTNQNGDEIIVLNEGETPMSKIQESVGDTEKINHTPAKRLFSTPTIGEDDNASANKLPKAIKLEK